MALTNLRLCFPELSEQEREALARRVMISTGEAILEMAGAFHNQRIDLDKRLTVSGLEHLETARREGHGVMLLGMHFNSIDVGSRLLGKFFRFSVVYRPNDNPLLDHLITKGRGTWVNHSVDRNDIRQTVRLLRQGEVVWYAPDQDYGRKASVFVPLFGVQAATVTATSTFARLGKAQVVPFTQTRLADGSGYRLTVHPPLEGFPGENETADALRINQWVEQAISQQPEQYMWVHRRFKTRPEGESRPYAKRRRRKRRARRR